MTFEEAQQAIAEMLAVQKGLQTSQAEFRQSLLELRDGTALNQNGITITRKGIKELGIEISNLKEISLSHERRMQQLFGCSVLSVDDRSDLLQRVQALERRTSKLEQKDNEPPENDPHLR